MGHTATPTASCDLKHKKTQKNPHKQKHTAFQKHTFLAPHFIPMMVWVSGSPSSNRTPLSPGPWVQPINTSFTPRIWEQRWCSVNVGPQGHILVWQKSHGRWAANERPGPRSKVVAVALCFTSVVLSKSNVRHSYKAAVWSLQPVFLCSSSLGTSTSLQWAVLTRTVESLQIHAVPQSRKGGAALSSR